MSPRVDQLAHALARARPERAGLGDGPTGPRRFFLAYSLAGWRRSTAPRLDQLAHALARARPERAGPGDGPTGAAPILFSLFAGGVEAIDRTFGVDRPLSS